MEAMGRFAKVLVVGAGALLPFNGIANAADDVESKSELRVCADPNNLPFSDRNGNGFENKLAEMVAESLGKKVAYTWWAQRRGFVRMTLKTHDCDVVMGVPRLMDMLETTRPYYRSSYVFVSREDRALNIQSIKDPRLKGFEIGVQLIGNDGFNTPPAHALGEQGIVENVKGYTVYGNYAEASPPARIIEAVEKGDIDVAAAWGPLAGYFAKNSPVPLSVSTITETDTFAPLRFDYDIAMGVRRGDHELKTQLDEIIARKQPEITDCSKAMVFPLCRCWRKANKRLETSTEKATGKR
jgi:quinoprotein dehydrogenase-associated probable ABC transporter substrate-binding protein